MTVSIAQMAVARADPDQNLEKARSLVAEAAGRGSDLICFPEMWTTGFGWEKNRSLAPHQQGIIDQVARLAAQHHIWINGSMLALDESNRMANTSIVFSPEGRQAGVYRKVHLFSLIHENEHVAAGHCLTTVDAPWGRLGLSICYDLRFPEMFRAYAVGGVQVQLCPAAFPHPRREHWRVLLRARAIEDQMFMIAANQVGTEQMGSTDSLTYCGSSAIIDPWGQTVIEADQADEQLLTATIDISQVQRVRGKITVLRDRRPELYGYGGG